MPQRTQRKPRLRQLLVQHVVDEGVELTAVDYLHEGLAAALIADDVQRGRVVDLDRRAERLVSIDERGELAFGIDDEGHVHFVLSGKLFGEAAEVLRRDLKLVREDVVAKLVAQR